MTRLMANPNAGRSILVSAHGYAGDKGQIMDLLPMYEHHGLPLVIVSPEDSRITGIKNHICIFAGKRAYVGQDSWTRQHLQMKALLQFPQEWFLMNDSDSFCLSPKLPDYLFQDKDIVWNNEVDDFRKPGQNWEQYQPIPNDYHAGYDNIAMQPPYFCHRSALEKLVIASENLVACPITPYIDWFFVPATKDAGLKHQCFHNAVSCESKSNIGQRWMRHRIIHGAEFIHSVKSYRIMRDMIRYAPR